MRARLHGSSLAARRAGLHSSSLAGRCPRATTTRRSGRRSRGGSSRPTSPCAALPARGVATGERVLDVGCGEGGSRASCSRAGAYVLAVDVAEEPLRRARGAPSRPGRAAGRGRRAWELADASFDVVWAGEVIEHVADTAAWLSEVRRVLRPQGAPAAEHARHTDRLTLAAARAVQARVRARASTRAAITCASTAADARARCSRTSASSEIDVRAAGGRPGRARGCCSPRAARRASESRVGRAQRFGCSRSRFRSIRAGRRRSLRARSTRGSGRSRPAAPSAPPTGLLVQVVAREFEPGLRVRGLQAHGPLQRRAGERRAGRSTCCTAASVNSASADSGSRATAACAASRARRAGCFGEQRRAPAGVRSSERCGCHCAHAASSAPAIATPATSMRASSGAPCRAAGRSRGRAAAWRPGGGRGAAA